MTKFQVIQEVTSGWVFGLTVYEDGKRIPFMKPRKDEPKVKLDKHGDWSKYYFFRTDDEIVKEFSNFDGTEKQKEKAIEETKYSVKSMVMYTNYLLESRQKDIPE